MIIVLAKAYNPGDADPGVSYTHLHIDTIVYSSDPYTATVVYTLGTVDALGEYVPGAASQRKTETATSAELASFATAMSPAGEPALITTQKTAYQFLISHRGIAGTIDLTLPAAPNQPSAAVASNDVAPSSGSTATSTATSTGSGS